MNEKEDGPGNAEATIRTCETTTTSHHHEAEGRFNHTALAPHRRWADAVRRMPLLACGCRAQCHCTMPPLSDHQLDGWADCARYVMDTSGCIPLLPVEVLRALWRRGGEDRALAEKIQAATNGAVAR